MKCKLGDVTDFFNSEERKHPMFVEGRFGYKEIEAATITAKNSEQLKISMSNNRSVICSPKHKWLSSEGWILAKELKPNCNICSSDNTLQKVKRIELLDNKADLYDIQVADVKEFYANGLVSHNSTVIDALYFAMYGKTFRKLKKDQIVNSINKKQCMVELDFSNSGREYKIVRGLAPNVFELYIDGVKKEQDASVHDYQTYIESTALKIDQRTMRQVGLIGSSAFVPFMELKTPERRQVVEELLDIQIFSVMNTVLKSKASSLASEYSDVSSNISKLKSNLAIIEKHLAEKNKQTDEMIFSNNEQIKLIHEEVDRLEAEQEDIRSKISELLELVTKETSSKTVEKELNTIISSMLHNKKIAEKEMKFFKDNNDCPTCLQTINDGFKHGEIRSRTQKIERLEEGLSVAKTKLDDITRKMKIVADHQEAIYKHELSLSSSTARKKAIISQAEQLEEAVEKLKKESYSEASTEEYDTIVSELKDETSKKTNLAETGEYYNVISTLLKDNGIKSAIIKNYVGTINSLVKKYMEIMGFNCEFTFDEEFNETMKSRYRDKFSYSNFSTGQQLRISLSILFAFRELAALKNSAATNILILDEIHSSSLDDEGNEAFLKIVEESSKSSNVLLISHDPALDEADFIDRRIMFENVNNFTKATINT